MLLQVDHLQYPTQQCPPYPSRRTFEEAVVERIPEVGNILAEAGSTLVAVGNTLPEEDILHIPAVEENRIHRSHLVEGGTVPEAAQKNRTADWTTFQVASPRTHDFSAAIAAAAVDHTRWTR